MTLKPNPVTCDSAVGLLDVTAEIMWIPHDAGCQLHMGKKKRLVKVLQLMSLR